MWQGALILLIGIAVGWCAAFYAPKPRPKAEQAEDKYKDFKDPRTGLYTRRTVESR